MPSQLWGYWHTLPLLTFSWIQKWIPLLCSEFFTHSLFPQFQEPAFSLVSVSIWDEGEWRPLSGGNKKEIIFISIIVFERYLFCLSIIHFHHWVVSHCIDYTMSLFTHHVLLGIWDIYFLIILLLKKLYRECLWIHMLLFLSSKYVGVTWLITGQVHIKLLKKQPWWSEEF